MNMVPRKWPRHWLKVGACAAALVMSAHAGAAETVKIGFIDLLSGPFALTGQSSLNQLREVVARKGSFVQTLKAVAWSFLGIRRGAGWQEDISRLNPVHVIVAGVIAALVFVLGLVWLVRWIIASGIAQ